MFVRIWVFLSVIAVVKAQGPSKTVLNFLTLYTGHWNNKAQIENGGKDHDFIDTWIIPVDVPALRPKPVVLIEETNNGALRLLNLGVVSDGSEKNSAIMTLYNFTDISKLKPRTFDVRMLNQLTLKDLHSGEGCYAVFDVVEKGLLSGDYPYCSYSANGNYLRFSVSSTCDSATVSFPQGTSQKSPIGPYVFRRIPPRYPLLNQPEDYVSPCDHMP